MTSGRPLLKLVDVEVLNHVLFKFNQKFVKIRYKADKLHRMQLSDYICQEITCP